VEEKSFVFPAIGSARNYKKKGETNSSTTHGKRGPKGFRRGTYFTATKHGHFHHAKEGKKRTPEGRQN